MAELDPVTFFIATELFASSDQDSFEQLPVLADRNSATRSTLIMLAHGSKDPCWRVPLDRIGDRAQRNFGRDSVRVAYLRFISPSLPEVIEDLLSRRVHQFRVLPLFLSHEERVTDEVPELLQSLCHKYAAVEIELLPAINEDPSFQRLIWQIMSEHVMPKWLVRSS